MENSLLYVINHGMKAYILYICTCIFFAWSLKPSTDGNSFLLQKEWKILSNIFQTEAGATQNA